MSQTQTIDCKKLTLTHPSTHIYHLVMYSAELNSHSFRAGQYLNICMPDGSKRPFSIASAPSDNGHIELIIRAAEDAPVSMEILQHLQHSDQITIELAMGNNHLPKANSPVVFIAGGTGIAPVRAILQSLANTECDRSIRVYWGVRDEHEWYLLDDIRQTINVLPHAELVQVCAEPGTTWQGRHGFVHQAALDDHPQFGQEQIYICGSMPMVKAVYQELKQQGARDHQIHSDMLDIMRQFGELPPAEAK